MPTGSQCSGLFPMSQKLSLSGEFFLCYLHSTFNEANLKVLHYHLTSKDITTYIICDVSTIEEQTNAQTMSKYS